MVDIMVDVDVPLTMNLRAVNISKYKAQGCYRCLAEALRVTPGTIYHAGFIEWPHSLKSLKSPNPPQSVHLQSDSFSTTELLNTHRFNSQGKLRVCQRHLQRVTVDKRG
jgi:hypothetical protein